MPQLDLKALERVLTRQNFLFKHQIANLVGISYERLTQIIAERQDQVEEEVVTRLCNGLGCRRDEIVLAD